MTNSSSRMSDARKWLIAIWIFFGLTNLGIIIYLFFSQQIDIDNFKAALSQFNVSYTPYLGTILSFFWSDRKNCGIRKHSKTSSLIAIIFSVVWNCLILTSFLKLLFQYGFIEDSIQTIKEINDYLVWLVAGSIGYYFGRS